ncbi:uncharacterized protein LOC135847873 [Planococcus citri]|uniref:uncharacterized protein LOC135847873 n=1 Tax=Planococcus citri TaxID=170843 RepID=UPI0031F8157C
MHSVRCSLLVEMHNIRAIIFLVLLATGKISAESRIAIANYHGNRMQPINIVTDKAFKSGFMEANLIRNGNGAGEKALLINTGKSVEVRLLETQTDLFAAGAVTAGYLFVYTRTIFYWAEKSTGTAGTLINDKDSTPLEVSQLYYNTKYRSYTDSLQKSDGILDIRMRFRADAEKDNSKFKPFQEKLKEVQKPGSTSVEMGKHNSWYLDFDPAAIFAYPGSVTNVTQEKTYNCTITIINKSIFSLSKNQFEAFTNIETDEDTKLITKQKTQDEGDRPVIKTNDVVFLRSIFNMEKVASFA